MIASFWADADLRGSGTVYYRESCNGSELLRAADLINDKYGEFSEPTSVVVVTWENVGYFKNHTDKVQPYWQQSSTITLVQLTKQWNIHLFTQYKNIHLFVVYIPHIVVTVPVSIVLLLHSIPQLNTHQIVIAVGCGTPAQSYVIFLFKSIQWTTGDSSGGKRGRGGNRAQVGHSSGDGNDSMTIPGSSTTDLVHLPFMRDTGYLPDNINTGIFVSSLESGEAARSFVHEQRQKPASNIVYEQHASKMVYEQQMPPTWRTVYEQQDKPTSRMVYEQQDKSTSRMVYEQQDPL